MLLSEAIEALAIATRADGRSQRTVQAYREKLGHLVRFLGDVPVEAVTVHDLRRYVAGLYDQGVLYEDHPLHRARKGALSPHTVAGRVIALKRLFRWLHREGVLVTDPTERIETPRPKTKEPKAISQDDLLRLLATTEGASPIDVRDRAIILLLADSGCRVGALCRLRPQDLDLERGLAVLSEKGGAVRYAMFTPTTGEALQAWLAERLAGWVFTSMHGGPLTANLVSQMLAKRARLSGCTGPTNAHSFRHGFARFYLLDGGDLGTLADILGHSDVSVTKQYYAIFTVEELQEKHRRHSPVARLLEDNGNGK